MAGKKVLVIASNCGFWGEELQAPWDAVAKAGHHPVLATPRGRKPLPFAISVDPTFVDPIQNYNVNPPEVCDRIKTLMHDGTWDSPISVADAAMTDYDALVMAGGPGTDLDMTNNGNVHRLILEALGQGKLVAAMCFAVAALAFTRDPANDYRSVVFGKTVTAHPRAWDFTADLTYDLYEAEAIEDSTEVAVMKGASCTTIGLSRLVLGSECTVPSGPTASRIKSCTGSKKPGVMTLGLGLLASAS